MSAGTNIARQALIFGVAGVLSLGVLLGLIAVGESIGLWSFVSWFGHGMFIGPWTVLAVLFYIPMALLDDRRRHLNGVRRTSEPT